MQPLPALTTLALFALFSPRSPAPSVAGDPRVPELEADVAPLFEPATPAELQTVLAEWAQREAVVEGWQVEAEGVVDGHLVRVVSHLVEGERHYGALRFPSSWPPAGEVPVLVWCHGGFDGTSVGALPSFDAAMPSGCVPSSFLYVLPSFRSERLAAGSLGNFASEGAPQPFDRDVDDALALLQGVLDTVPAADRMRIAAYGTSRGAAVAMLLGLRDPRVRAVVDLFGPVDHQLPSLAAEVQAVLDGETEIASGLMRHLFERIVWPWIAGDVDTAEARLRLVRASMAAHRACDLPPIQLHHGALDEVVSIEHAEQFVAALGSCALAPPHEYHAYAGGGHSSGSLAGQGPRVEAWLCEVLDLPQAYCHGAPSSTGAGALVDWRGTVSVARNDFELRARGLPLGQAGFFYYGRHADESPFGDGWRCVKTPHYRLDVVPVDGAGGASSWLDLGHPPHPAARIDAGETWRFQFWYRDPAGPGGSGFNFSDALRATFRP